MFGIHPFPSEIEHLDALVGIGVGGILLFEDSDGQVRIQGINHGDRLRGIELYISAGAQDTAAD
jgi:hypothetical protein